MGVIYRYLSSAMGPLQQDPSNPSSTSSTTTSRLTDQLYRLIPSTATKKSPKTTELDLSKTVVKSHDLLYNVCFSIIYLFCDIVCVFAFLISQTIMIRSLSLSHTHTRTHLHTYTSIFFFFSHSITEYFICHTLRNSLVDTIEL
jgi:hypothetical protein